MILLGLWDAGTASWAPRGWQHHLTYTGAGRPLRHIAAMRSTPARWCVTCDGGRVVRDAQTMVPDACPTCGGSGVAS